MGRWLVLGGTRFLSRAVAATAAARGHEVVCVARGASGAVPDGAKLLVADRDVPGALEPLRGEPFDAVVDVARMSLPWVRSALDALGRERGALDLRLERSTCTPTAPRPARASAPRSSCRARTTTITDDEDAYGPIKVASENAVRDARRDAGR